MKTLNVARIALKVPHLMFLATGFVLLAWLINPEWFWISSAEGAMDVAGAIGSRQLSF